ncbi:hypothetical protein KIK06_18070 [Nocardiopsis sp. EMB25]|uniref:hypothetical protein n=1 Tax=Nocardiopsis sp. EMB25 TaxID=2835867 RepID=UPI002283A9BE|nr:hypothetical protein [Nocardiopsis sp. EMB25]MCY9785798.1 hypothetical protein [Nocardiopsis sp. EMB25]
MNAHHRTVRRVLALGALALFASACSQPGQEPGESTSDSPTDPSAAPSAVESAVEEDVAASGAPDGPAFGEEFQPAVDCLVEAGAAEEGYTVEQLEEDIFGGFGSGLVDTGHAEFDACLDLTGVEIDFGGESGSSSDTED